jgi:hypothetical protein
MGWLNRHVRGLHRSERDRSLISQGPKDELPLARLESVPEPRERGAVGLGQAPLGADEFFKRDGYPARRVPAPVRDGLLTSIRPAKCRHLGIGRRHDVAGLWPRQRLCRRSTGLSGDNASKRSANPCAAGASPIFASTVATPSWARRRFISKPPDFSHSSTVWGSKLRRACSTGTRHASGESGSGSKPSRRAMRWR